MFEKIRNMIVDQLDVAPDDVQPEFTFEDIGADSLDFVELIMDIENEFEIEMPEDELGNIKTVDDLVAAVQSKTQN